jgi:hypothetical protein
MSCQQGFTYLQVTGLTTHSRYSFKIQARNFNEAGYEAGLGCGADIDVVQSTDAASLLPCVVAAPVQQPHSARSLLVKSATSTSSTPLIELQWLPPPGSEQQFRQFLSFSVSRAIVVGEVSGEEVLVGTRDVEPRGNVKRMIVFRDEISDQAVDGVVFRYTVRARNANSLGYEQGLSVKATVLNDQCLVRMPELTHLLAPISKCFRPVANYFSRARCAACLKCVCVFDS